MSESIILTLALVKNDLANRLKLGHWIINQKFDIFVDDLGTDYINWERTSN